MTPMPMAALLLLVLLAALTAYNREPARTRRRLRRAARSDIGAAREGPVKIGGTLKLPGEPLRAPLSGRRCALWEVVVSQGDALLIHDRMACDFLLDDGTGTALVRAAPGRPGGHLDLAIVQDSNARSGFLMDPTPEQTCFLAQHGKKTQQGLFFNLALTYREGAFEPGERIAVCGRARREPDPDASAPGGTYRERPTRLVIEPLDGKLLLSDEPGVAELPDHSKA